MPSTGFSVSRDGIPIEKLDVATSIQTGIAYDIQIPGLVPFFEEYEAMVRANCNDEQWGNVHYSDKAKAVAFHRLKKIINLHEGDAVEVHRKQKPGQK
ncbi:hypothetical protein LCGC14_1236220 [marine sediment metagenome]|uniref:Uncharacterized protein n=1 Tax=marine sediment metagenome TaxID=412755 RepID=A0A0F9LB81_9ZZZZ